MEKEKELVRQQIEDNRVKKAAMKREKNSPVSGNKAHNWSSIESGRLH